MTPYAPPPSPQAPSPDLDVAAAATPFIVRFAGGLTAFAGIITALTSVQTFSNVTVFGFMAVAPWVLLLLGLVTAVVGAQLMRAREWAAVTSAALAASLFVSTGFWLFFSFSNGFVSLFALANPFLAMIAFGFALASLGPSRRASEARARLEEQGLSLGL